MAERQIPDRSDEPALQESLDRGPQSTTAANSDDAKQDAQPQKRDDEGNAVAAEQPKAKPDDQEIEALTGVPASAEQLSSM